MMLFLSSFISAQSGGTYDIGLETEDVAKVAPFFAWRNKEGVVEGVRYERLNMVLINAVKEQQTQIMTLVKQNRSQQIQIEQLQRASRTTQRINVELRRRLTRVERKVKAQSKAAIKRN